jgi:hypothetical protein
MERSVSASFEGGQAQGRRLILDLFWLSAVLDLSETLRIPTLLLFKQQPGANLSIVEIRARNQLLRAVLELIFFRRRRKKTKLYIAPSFLKLLAPA